LRLKGLARKLTHREEFHKLALRLRELAPDHAIFEEAAFFDEEMGKLTSLGS
jgi:hypothetical protein